MATIHLSSAFAATISFSLFKSDFSSFKYLTVTDLPFDSKPPTTTKRIPFHTVTQINSSYASPSLVRNFFSFIQFLSTTCLFMAIDRPCLFVCLCCCCSSSLVIMAWDTQGKITQMRQKHVRKRRSYARLVHLQAHVTWFGNSLKREWTSRV